MSNVYLAQQPRAVVLKKPDGTVVLLRQLVAGSPGTVWYTGTAAPSSSVGLDGDFFLRTDTGDVYRKVAGAWVLSLTLSLVGGGGAVTSVNGQTGAVTVAPVGATYLVVGSDPTLTSEYVVAAGLGLQWAYQLVPSRVATVGLEDSVLTDLLTLGRAPSDGTTYTLTSLNGVLAWASGVSPPPVPPTTPSLDFTDSNNSMYYGSVV